MSSHKQEVFSTATANAKDCSTDLYSTAVDINQISIGTVNWSFISEFTGSPSGSLYVQASNDKTNWVTDSTNYYENISGSAALVEPYAMKAEHTSFAYVRLFWDAETGSTGTIQAQFASNEG